MRKKYLEILIVLAFVCTTLVNGFAQITMNLQEVLEKVKLNSYAAKSATNTFETEEYAFQNFESSLKPFVSVGANLPNYVKSSVGVTQPDGSIAFQSVSQMNSSVFASATHNMSSTGTTLFAYSDIQRFEDLSTSVKQYNGTPIRLGFIQPILGFNALKFDKKIAKLRILEARKRFDLDIETALQQATDLYFDVLISQQNVEIAETNKTVNENLLLITEERLKLGKVSEDEKLQLEIELNNAIIAYSQAKGQLENALGNLLSFINEVYESKIIILESPEKIDALVLNDNALIESFHTNRPQILAYERAKIESQKNIAQIKGEQGMQVSLEASVGLTRGSNNYTDIYADPFTEQNANVSVRIPILDWGRRKSAIKQEELFSNELDMNLNQLQLEVSNQIKTQSQRLKMLVSELETLQKIMSIAQKRFKISNERYILGNIDITNLTLAQREKDQAKRNYLFALENFWVSYFDLRRLTGLDPFTNNKIEY